MENRVLSVIIPVYNEVETIIMAIEMVLQVDTSPFRKQVIVVDDGSTDGTREILKGFSNKYKEINIIFHKKNMGKGAALRTGFSVATGDAVIIQDADMEYNPKDWQKMLPLLLKGEADVIYGSRFLGQSQNWIWSHRLGNKALSALTTLLYGHRVTDMETCYKLVKKDVLDLIHIKAERFDFEPEITAKLLKLGVRYKEVPISYRGRSFKEGKKIRWYDGFNACWILLKYKFTG